MSNYNNIPMTEDEIMDLFRKGYSVQYITSQYYLRVNRYRKQWNPEFHCWNISRNNMKRSECQKKVYEVLLKNIQGGRICDVKEFC